MNGIEAVISSSVGARICWPNLLSEKPRHENNVGQIHKLKHVSQAPVAEDAGTYCCASSSSGNENDVQENSTATEKKCGRGNRISMKHVYCSAGCDMTAGRKGVLTFRMRTETSLHVFPSNYVASHDLWM